ncbi:hypothetical protein [Sulfurimonas sp.]|uniref:hypothetical protein n=1 Tax=Sulfurimonas sp. TaxID=2022749 RepID=UPI0026222F5E|nr:hypothetical protein [Sulfurimonas sp.]MDD5157783.1 hypothetical protein [Sulfurimonas sp.]
MLAFFSMVANGFGLIFAFISKYTGFFNTASLLSNFRFLSRKLLFVIVIVMIVALFAILIAFFYFTVDSLISAFNLISALLVRIQTMSGGGGSADVIFLFLNASGFTTGFNIAFPFIASALTFRLMKFLYLSFSKLLEKTTTLVMNFSSAITAS